MFNPAHPGAPVSPMHPNNNPSLQNCNDYLPALGLNEDDRVIINWTGFVKGDLEGRYYNVQVVACGDEGCESVEATSSVDTSDGAEAENIDVVSLRARTVGCHSRKYGESLAYMVVLTENHWMGRWDEPAGSIEFKIRDLRINRSTPLKIGDYAEFSVYVSR